MTDVPKQTTDPTDVEDETSLSSENTKENPPVRESQHENEQRPPAANGGAAPWPSEKPAVAPGPPPNGGAKAWLQVVGSWMLFFNTWGLLNTFGVYQTYYESGELFQETSSNISWIGSVQAFLVLVVGSFSGPVYDRGYFRPLLAVGSFLVVFGHMMLSLCHEYWQVILAQGFTIGLGAGCLFVPAVAIMPTYFSTKIGMAIGLAASGSSMGGIIYPIVFYRLISRIGFAWSVRVLGFMTLATLMIPLALMRMRFRPPKARALLDTSAFKDLDYVFFTVSAMIGYIGLYVALFYLSYYGIARHITDASLSFYLVPILNAGSVFGRTLPNILSDKIGPFNVVIPGALITGLLILCTQAVDSAAGLVVMAALIGFFSGIYIALPPVLFVALTPNKAMVGTRMGMGFGLLAAGVLIGAPGGGGILQMHEDRLEWTGMWTFGGVCTVFSGLCFACLRVKRGGWGMKKI